jgi:DNA helicase-2/ATP-dependent DNA helicase PcrA
MAWNDGLDGPHLQIAASDGQRIGVLAGPGTGKTSYGLMRRVMRLLEEGVAPTEILLVSFTRTAAHDLRAKIADLGVPGAEDVRATTLHAFCFGLLQRDAVLPITGRTPRPLLDHEIDMMLRDIPGDFGNLDSRRDLLRGYEAGWARRATDHPGLAEAEDREFEVATVRWLRDHRAILIGEVVPLAFAYLRDNPMAEERTRYRHVVADEYQDLNAVEQALLELVAGDGALCIAGDDDQSIYRFRFANPEGIVNFCEREDVERVDIEGCRRCPRAVVEMASELIAHAPDRAKEPLVAESDVAGRVSVVQWGSLDEEVEGLASEIARSITDGEREAGDVLLLVHRQRIGQMLRQRLNDLGIAACSFFAQEAVATEHAKRSLALLRLAVGDDAVSLRVILGLGDATSRADAYARLTTYAREHGQTRRDVLDALRDRERLELRVPALVERHGAAVASIDELPRDDVEAAINVLFPEDVPDVADIRALAIEELPESPDLSTLADRLVARVTQHDVPETPDFVRVMSLHKSKGLTSPVVYVAAMIDGIVPTIPARFDEDERQAAYDEQRRLVYVAITRSADELIISSSIRMDLGLARSMGVRVEAVRKIGEQLVAITIASPYMHEMVGSAPAAIRGIDWLAQR